MARPPFQVGEFVGQQRAIAPVLREQDGAKARGEPLPHLLLIGSSGLGKSLASREIGARAGSQMIKFTGLEKLENIVNQLVKLKAGDLAFFDEAHKLSSVVQEALYEVIDANIVPAQLVVNGTGQEPVKVAPVTLIFATDKPGDLNNALLKRIPTTVTFQPYPESELKEVVAHVAKRRNLLLSPQAARRIARVCNGLPRRAEHHVQKLRLFFHNSESQRLGLPQIEEYLTANGINAVGLGRNERRFLIFLARNGSASLEALAAHLGVDANYVSSQIEQPLRFRRLVMVCAAGRKLTNRGKQWLRKHGKVHVSKENNEPNRETP